MYTLEKEVVVGLFKKDKEVGRGCHISCCVRVSLNALGWKEDYGRYLCVYVFECACI